MAPESKPPIARIAATSSCPPIEIYAARMPRKIPSPQPNFKNRIIDSNELGSYSYASCPLSTSQRLVWLENLVLALCPEKGQIPLYIRGKNILFGAEKIGNVLKPGAQDEKLRVWADLLFASTNQRPEKKPLISLLPLTVLPIHFKASYTQLMVSATLAKFAAITYEGKNESIFFEFYTTKKGSPIASFMQK